MFRKNLILPSLLALAPLTAVGCLTESANGPDPGVEDVGEERGPIGKADLFGQCRDEKRDRCGGKSSGNCWCDEACSTFGDCCSDYADACEGESCDPTLLCGQAISCVEGQWYPTTCGPANCDAPMGPCGEPEPECDPGLFCTQVLTCVDGALYPTGCGPANCDAPIGPCGDPEPECNPELFCTQVLTCVDGELYPTGCGPANCDAPIGPC